MEEYCCKSCKYHSGKLYCFKMHLLSKKHIAKVEKEKKKTRVENGEDGEDGEKVENEEEQQNVDFEKIKIYCCDNCDNFYMSNQALKNHQAKCCEDEKMVALKKENAQLKKDLQKEIDEKKNCNNLLKDAMAIAKENSSIANTSMNILKYAKLHLNEGEPLEELKGENLSKVIGYKNPKKNEAKNDTYVKTAIHKFNHHIFPAFIGDMIVEYYTPKKTKDANLITTDTSRLSFIIMQKITKSNIEQNEWINDKSGNKFTELVLKPLINAVKETLIEFVEFKKKKDLSESNLCLMAKCVELKRDIEVDKFTNPILRYVAPHFHFDKLKLLDEKDDLAHDLVEPVKIVTKKSGKKIL